VVATLHSLESAAAGAPGAGTGPATVDGWPVTPAQARVLLERLNALCPGGLQAPPGGDLLIAVVDVWGRHRAGSSPPGIGAAGSRAAPTGPAGPIRPPCRGPPRACERWGAGRSFRCA